MIRYQLRCSHDHEFEAWFSHSKDFDTQQQKGLLECPYCGDKNIEKAIMTPSVSTSRKKEAAMEKQHARLGMMNAAAERIRKEIADKCDYVGDKLPEEARAIHYGETEERPIYGEASPKEIDTLTEEGIELTPLPRLLTPKPKPKLN